MSNRDSTTVHAIKRNDWSPLAPPPEFRPTLRVAVVVTGAADRARLDPTLAALRHQSYPADLLDVVVARSTRPPVAGSAAADPERGAVVPAAAGNAFDAAVVAAGAEVIVRLDAGSVPDPEFVAALARWQHVTPDAVSIASPRLVAAAPTADEVAAHCADGALDGLFPAGASTPHAPLVARLEASDQLRAADHLGFLAADGVPYAFHTDRYTPGADPYQGVDIEVAYRLAQAGGVFVPEPRARVWMVAGGPDGDATRHRRAELADLMAYPRDNRPAAGRAWSVPLVTAVVAADGPYELVRTCVDRLLGNDETDLRVLLVGDRWSAAGGGARGSAAGGGDRELRLIAAEYRSEPRVRLVDADPGTGYPSPYLLRVPHHLGVGATTVRALVTTAERWQVGLIRVLPAGAAGAVPGVELWRTDALSRALRTERPGPQLASAVARSHGHRWETGSEYDVVDLTAVPAPQLRSPARVPAAAPVQRRSRETVQVGGARSLAKATVFVTRRYARAARRRIARG
ncbi:hypothetical protein SAMN05444365_11246 [Micromonospora pattaloongensis]|uniref:Glycosyl transferase family 2 n=1 Tax=Micromonospora pattaloongensis TaxID=405436 RepID=A0A1H3SMD7_9ACTN|nr:hypothetical protein [Micromonospora pattaloongensis]SDZ38289.1 hypothetical protein SAMN05444365_11246 [Micromonospora pattaloongensis]